MKHYLTLLFLVAFSYISLAATDSNNAALDVFKKDTVKKDTFNFYYNFYPKDTIYYKVETLDSTAFNFDVPLIKDKVEILRVICDSVIAGKYYLNFTTTQLLENDRKGSEKSDTRTTHPWLGRKAFIVIDSLGTRFSSTVEDSNSAVIAPSGPFGPTLLPPLKETQKVKEETWLNTTMLDLPEYGNPIPLIRQTYLFHFKEMRDTLEKRNFYYEYIATGQGSVGLSMEDNKIRLTNVLNGHGRVFLDTLELIPTFFFNTQEQKLVYTSGEKRKQGYHYTNTFFTLQKLIRNKTPEAIKPKKGKKK